MEFLKQFKSDMYSFGLLKCGLLQEQVYIDLTLFSKGCKSYNCGVCLACLVG